MHTSIKRILLIGKNRRYIYLNVVLSSVILFVICLFYPISDPPRYISNVLAHVTKETRAEIIISATNLNYNTIRNATQLICTYTAERIASEPREVPQYYIVQPRLIDGDSIAKQKIPYFYTLWKSAPKLPRVITPCEHQIYLNLLIKLDNLCRKYDIPYMMIGGTLLGSYKYHDFLPWDDDVDLFMPYSDKNRFVTAMNSDFKNISIEYLYLHNRYLKVYFNWSPNAGLYPWRFPFIDIFFYEQNQTYIWHYNDPIPGPMKKSDIFPLVLRPFSELWLPSPGNPISVFASTGWFSMETACYSRGYSHRREVIEPTIYTKCSELQDFYPFNIASRSSETIPCNILSSMISTTG
ncbi:unnamed protein product [Didymodactylos carnosus]|uniref:LicD/FKTN/FKRP nucleotidyltransferase domain-containing protein n=1 Tax=Didymodactylos carnosus TaxID=1234261 RepID=A0A814E2P1_9BILA|nr:unnamed protein product [Didymodactylos carnosus]CAF1008411.1 unnamed protein product [Didymodactylos carnosus]CAF3738960.1 unnamed protein product [Didymodactylos carnosus]CAF3777409.1 unnamed protein product [Didymodactylos carnosus]